MPKHQFFQAEFAGHTFVATAGHEAWVSRVDGRSLGPGAQLGDCSTIEYLNAAPPAYGREFIGAGFYICKYNNQIRLPLLGFERRDVEAFSRTFGMELGYTLDGDGDGDGDDTVDFWKSPAGEALAVWAADHPRLAARYAKGSPYIKWPSPQPGSRLPA